ncbi:hypothetical protein BH09PLA1_BH09PLA1_07980 [soil metagenome]
MSSPIPVVQRFLGRASQRIRRSRPGSILILVVALLVLVAIIGTAALSTNTIDRYATGQNNFNTQVDLIVEGLKNMAKSVLVADIKDSSAGPAYYRPAEGLAKTYDHWDMPLMIYPFTDPSDATIHPPTGADPYAVQLMQAANDAWLSPRYPELLNPHLDSTFVPSNTGTLILGTNPPVWDCIGAPLENANGIPPAGQKLFDSPGVFTDTGVLAGNTVSRSYNQRITDRTPAQAATVGNIVNPLTPTFITYQLNNQPVTMPAWKFTGVDTANPTREYFFIAGDADGDGIADSGLKRLGVGDVNGLTYFYGVRIVDNGSAVTVNTAWSRDHVALGDLPGTFDTTSRSGAAVANLSPNLFPTSIGLAELLRTSNSGTATTLSQLQFGATGTRNELGNIDWYRFNASGTGKIEIRPTGVVTDPMTGMSTRGQVFVDKAPGSVPITTDSGRNDFLYNTVDELLWMGLGRRVDNPGVLAQVAGADIRFRRFSVSDSAALAYRFCLVNPEASKSILESATSSATNPSNATPTPLSGGTMALDSLYWTASNKMDNGFRVPAVPILGNGFNMMNKKSYPSDLVGVGYWFTENFDWEQEYDFSSAANFKLENPQKYRNRRSMLTADNPVSNQVPTPLPPAPAPAAPYSQSAYTKASVNTAPFLELYSAFLGVMSEGPDSPYRLQNGSAQSPTPYWATPNTPPAYEAFYHYAGMKYALPTVTNYFSNPGDPQSPTSFAAAAGDTHIDRMFRGSIRDHGPAALIGDRNSKYDETTNTMTGGPVNDTKNAVHFQPKQMRKVRAYLAAANAIGMRTPGRRIQGIRVQQTQTDPLLARINDADSQVDLFVYPVEPQPYITEIYVNTDTSRSAREYDDDAPDVINTEPYVAIELFYPYPIVHPANVATTGSGAPWDLRPFTTNTGQPYSGWSLGIVNRDDAATSRTNGAFTNGVPIFANIVAGTNDNAYFDAPTTTDPRYGSYIILENFDESTGSVTTGAVKYRPRSSGLPYTDTIASVHTAGSTNPPVKSVYVKDLAKIVKNGSATPTPTMNGGELVLFRASVDNNVAETNANYIPPRPMDSFDFTGLEQESPVQASVWHYSRLGKQATGGAGEFWSFIYPGRYDGGLVSQPGNPSRRQQGTQVGTFINRMAPAGNPLEPRQPGYYDPFDPVLNTAVSVLDPPVTLGTRVEPFPSGGPTRLDDDNASPKATYPVTFKTQLLNDDQPGWNPVGGYPGTLAPPPNKFPFGAFARNADILQIPFFGAYRVRPYTPTGVPPDPRDIEVNAVSMDSAFCEDTDLFDDEGNAVAFPATSNLWTYEQLGRFCPLTLQLSGLQAGAVPIDDLDATPGRSYRYFYPDPQFNSVSGLPNTGWRYRWATRLFDYVTVQDPQSDYLPNVDPAGYSPKPEPVSNDGGTAGGSVAPAVANAENAAPIQGLININTAPWRVLATINWTPYPPDDYANRDRFTLVVRPDGEYEMFGGPDGVDDNIELAKAITWWRDGKDAANNGSTGPIGPKGPFRNLYDLYRVQALRTYYNRLRAQPPFGLGAPEQDDADGDFSPNNHNPLVTSTAIPPGDQVRYDFEERFELLSRVSNLITTRSDSYTVYIVVQGWRNVNDSSGKPPELVVQRRAAFIADRSGVTATGGALKITNVASE